MVVLRRGVEGETGYNSDSTSSVTVSSYTRTNGSPSHFGAAVVSKRHKMARSTSQTMKLQHAVMCMTQSHDCARSSPP